MDSCADVLLQLHFHFLFAVGLQVAYTFKITQTTATWKLPCVTCTWGNLALSSSHLSSLWITSCIYSNRQVQSYFTCFSIGAIRFSSLQPPQTKASSLSITGIDHADYIHFSSPASSVYAYKDGELLPLHMHSVSYWYLCPWLFQFLMFSELNPVSWNIVLCSLQNSSLRLAHIDVATGF